MKKTLVLATALTLVFASPVLAAETYSEYWKTDAHGNWKYYENGTTVAVNAWVHDHGEWYLLDSEGNMRTGVFQSNDGKYYLLDTVSGTGTYGKLLKNGMVYRGIALSCDTSEAYEGALSKESISALKAFFDFSTVPYVANTRHIEDTTKTVNSVPTSVSDTVTHDLLCGPGFGGNADTNNHQPTLVSAPNSIDILHDEAYEKALEEWYKENIYFIIEDAETEQELLEAEERLYELEYASKEERQQALRDYFEIFGIDTKYLTFKEHGVSYGLPSGMAGPDDYYYRSGDVLRAVMMYGTHSDKEGGYATSVDGNEYGYAEYLIMQIRKVKGLDY